jgi:hypothetical protein
MSPSPTLLPCPCGSAPFETHRGSHLCGSRCRDVIAHRRVSTPYPLSSVVSGAVLPLGHKSRSRCAFSALLRHRMRCGRCGGSCCGAANEKPSKIKPVAVLRFPTGD